MLQSSKQRTERHGSLLSGESRFQIDKLLAPSQTRVTFTTSALVSRVAHTNLDSDEFYSMDIRIDSTMPPSLRELRMLKFVKVVREFDPRSGNTQDLKIGSLAAALSNARHYENCTKTGRRSGSIM